MMLGQTTHFANKPDCKFYLDLNLYGSNKAKNPWSGSWNTSPTSYITTTDKKFGRASLKPGTILRYGLSSTINPNGLTITCWFKTSTISSARGLFGLLISGTTNRIQCAVNASGQIAVGVLKNNVSILDTVVYQNVITGTWTQFTCVISDKVYYGQNGVLVSRAFTTALDYNIDEIIIGNYQDNGTFLWPGYIDCFQIWRKSLIVPKRSSIQTREI